MTSCKLSGTFSVPNKLTRIIEHSAITPNDRNNEKYEIITHGTDT